MNPYSLPYINGYPQTHFLLCSRFLPPSINGIAKKWLQSKGLYGESPGSDGFILDAFGASPYLLSELAYSGYQVIVTSNNPILRFLADIQADPPDKNLLTSLLAEFACTRKGNERLEIHLRSIYQSRCQECNQIIEVEAFIWERNSLHDKPALTGKIYSCSNCAATGEYAASSEDILASQKFNTNSLYFSRCVERIASLNDPDRQQVEEGLEIYLPRALYVINTLLNLRDTLVLDLNSQKALDLLLLVAFEYGNSLWGYPVYRSRPRQLITSPRYNENNIWKAMESFVKEWTGSSNNKDPSITITSWPELPNRSGGICIYAGKLKEIASELKTIPIKAIIASLPRPNQAFWMLSAMWSGWLWGKDSVKPLKNILRRKRYDWGWHTSALYSSFRNIRDLLISDTNFLGLIGESEPAFVSASLLASDIAGFNMQGLAARPESNQTQIQWLIPPINHKKSEYVIPSQTELNNIDFQKGKFPNEYLQRVCSSVLAYISEHGEPLNFSQIHARTMVAMIDTKFFLSKLSENEISLTNFYHLQGVSVSELYTIANSLLEKILIIGNGFIRLAGSEKNLDIGQWWLREDLLHDTKIFEPLSDRVEKTLKNYLIKSEPKTLLEIDQFICNEFPGFHTPSSELIQVCLESYADNIHKGNDKWQLRDEDIPKNRKTELKHLSQLLKIIAHRLGYTSEGEQPVLWKNSSGSVIYTWYIITSAIISNIILNPKYPPDQSIILVPGGRANLVAYKLNHDLRLQKAINKGWRFIKFRQIRSLEESALLSPELFNEQLKLDKLTYSSPQMRLF